MTFELQGLPSFCSRSTTNNSLLSFKPGPDRGSFSCRPPTASKQFPHSWLVFLWHLLLFSRSTFDSIERERRASSGDSLQTTKVDDLLILRCRPSLRAAPERPSGPSTLLQLKPCGQRWMVRSRHKSVGKAKIDLTTCQSLYPSNWQILGSLSPVEG